MVAIDRRVGYIFVAFLSLLAVAVVRAVYLGRGPGRQPPAGGGQPADQQRAHPRDSWGDH